MNMQAYWSGFFTALALVLLCVVVAFALPTGGRVFCGSVAAIAAGVAAGLSHDAARGVSRG